MQLAAAGAEGYGKQTETTKLQEESAPLRETSSGVRYYIYIYVKHSALYR